MKDLRRPHPPWPEPPGWRTGPACVGPPVQLPFYGGDGCAAVTRQRPADRRLLRCNPAATGGKTAWSRREPGLGQRSPRGGEHPMSPEISGPAELHDATSPAVDGWPDDQANAPDAGWPDDQADGPDPGWPDGDAEDERDPDWPDDWPDGGDGPAGRRAAPPAALRRGG